MKKIYRIAFLTMLVGSVSMLTSCEEFWDMVEDNPSSPSTPVAHIADIKIKGADFVNGEVTILTGSTLQLSAEIYPVNTTELAIRWTTSDAGVLTVSPSGLVTAVSSGTVTVKVASKVNPSVNTQVTIHVVDDVLNLNSEPVNQSVAESRG